MGCSLGDMPALSEPALPTEARCQYAPCARTIVQTPGKRPRRFCCDAHRAAAWQLARSGRAVHGAVGGGSSVHIETLRQGLSALRDHADQLVRSLAEAALPPDRVDDVGSREDDVTGLRVRCTELQRRVHDLEIQLDVARREVIFVREAELPERVQQALAQYRQEERDKRLERGTTRTRAKRKAVTKSRRR
jgi:hypothetical protein